MKVILLQDVTRIGKRFDIAEVPDGYALNKLIPTGMAEAATKEKCKQIEARRTKAGADTEAAGASFSAAVQSLKENPLTISASANENGGLFKALSSDEVVASAAAAGVVIADNQVVFDSPVKEVGEHTITLVEGEQSVSVVITVAAQS